jgi:large subunit ribosomal protein L29
MKSSELRGLGGEEIKGKEEELSRELFTLRFRKASGRLENSARLRQIRRELARVKTILRERQLRIQKGE